MENANSPYYKWQSKLETNQKWTAAEVDGMFTELMEMKKVADHFRAKEMDAEKELIIWREAVSSSSAANANLLNKLDEELKNHGVTIAKFETAKAQIVTLKEKITRLENNIYCAYCGQEFGLGDFDKATKDVTEHIYTCEKHPLFILRKEIQDILNLAKSGMRLDVALDALRELL
jgi:hypothetical protein